MRARGIENTDPQGSGIPRMAGTISKLIEHHHRLIINEVAKFESARE